MLIIETRIKHLYGISILCILFIFGYYFVLSNPYNYDIKKFVITKQKLKETNDECLAEWSVLNKDVYFRRNLAFYYTDLKVIRLYFERKDPQHTFAFKRDLIPLYLTVYLNNNITEIYLNGSVHKVIHKYDFHSLEYIEFKFDYLTKIEPLKVKVKNSKYKESTSFIDLIIKSYRVKNELKKNHSMLCSKVYYFKNDLVKEFKWWIEMNRIHGYSKIVIYNNSIENSTEFNKLLNENKGFVELIQFRCIPNFMTRNNFNKMFITNFDDITKYWQPVLHVHVHFEQLVLNECYLQNMDKYKYITINDQDETIVPRYLKNYKQQENDLVKNSDQFMKKAESLCYYNQEQKTNETNIEIYLNKLLNNYKNKTSTFHFKMGVYMKQKTMDLIFNEIEKLNFIDEQITSYNYTIRIYDDKELNYWKQTLDFKIIIKSKEEYEYAQYLYEVYKTVYKPFYMQNKDKFNSIPESYNRLFYLLGQSTNWFGGKTIHNTLLTESLTTHDASPLDDTVKIIPIENGYSSHFRKNYNLEWNQKSIKEFRFDLNYFLCYYKPILKIFQ